MMRQQTPRYEEIELQFPDLFPKAADVGTVSKRLDTSGALGAASLGFNRPSDYFYERNQTGDRFRGSLDSR
jgi:hypothetical protein